MFKLIVKNLSGKKLGGGTFETLELANAWLADGEKEKMPWGEKKARWLFESEFDDEKIEDATETRVVNFQATDLEPEHSETQYRFKAEYEIIGPTDITAKVEAERSEKLARRNDILAIKEMIQDLNDDADLKPYLRRILKRVVRDMKE